jgi:TPR repeat protein
MPTPLLIVLAVLLVAPTVYFYAGEYSFAPEQVREAKLVALDPQGAAPTAQPVDSTVGVAVLPSQSAASKTPTEPSVPRLSAADVQLLMNWGQEFMRMGDLAAAPVAFRRAAQAGDAAAALAMGSTYDPLVLQRIGALGVTPDPDLARTWYERAKDLGLPEAPGRPETRRDPSKPELNPRAGAAEIRPAAQEDQARHQAPRLRSLHRWRAAPWPFAARAQQGSRGQDPSLLAKSWKLLTTTSNEAFRFPSTREDVRARFGKPPSEPAGSAGQKKLFLLARLSPAEPGMYQHKRFWFVFYNGASADLYAALNECLSPAAFPCAEI